MTDDNARAVIADFLARAAHCQGRVDTADYAQTRTRARSERDAWTGAAHVLDAALVAGGSGVVRSAAAAGGAPQ